MSSGDGVTFSGGNMAIMRGGRQVLTTTGHLIMGIPPQALNLSKSITFPDVNKAQGWQWQGYSHNYGPTSGGYDWGLEEAGFGYITALPQEWSLDTTVAAAPTGANAFLGLIRINRTTSPTKTWLGNTVDVKPKTGVWIPNCGSILLESEIGLCRSMTLAIKSGNLVLSQQQSVSAAVPGGWNTGYNDNGHTSSGDSNREVQWTSINPTGTTKFVDPGWPVYTDSTLQTGIQTYDAVMTAGVQPAYAVNCQVGGTKWINLYGKDPSNYKSIYTIDIQGEFVRMT